MFCIPPIAGDTAYIIHSVNSHEDILGYLSGHAVLDTIKIEQKCTRFFCPSRSEYSAFQKVCNQKITVYRVNLM